MQGKSPKQYSDSARAAGFAIIGVIMIMMIAPFIPMSDSTDPRPAGPGYNYWVPTEEDIQELDSLHDIVKETNTDLDTVRKSLDRCLDKLDKIWMQQNDIIHWEVVDGEMSIYTKEDSIRDEQERWRYIDSIERADDAYSKWMELQ